MQDTIVKEKTSIVFKFLPHKYESGNFSVIKADNEGKQRRYVAGVSSGPNVDGHGERMTDKAVKAFMDQMSGGDVLLYPDEHGIKASEDIGIAVEGSITPEGDWHTVYRLYDESDGVGQSKLDKINTLWKQINGEAPYTKPRQFGFSIEGDIPDGGIVTAEIDEETGQMTHRVIDEVSLDGVVLVPKPAYKTSVAQAIYKALGEMFPAKKEKILKNIQSKLSERIKNREEAGEYHSQKWDINDSLEGLIDEIMSKPGSDKLEALLLAFDEYKKLMTELIMNSESLFVIDDSVPETINNAYGKDVPVSKKQVLEAVYIQINKLTKLYKDRLNDKKQRHKQSGEKS